MILSSLSRLKSKKHYFKIVFVKIHITKVMTKKAIPKDNIQIEKTFSAPRSLELVNNSSFPPFNALKPVWDFLFCQYCPLEFGLFK